MKQDDNQVYLYSKGDYFILLLSYIFSYTLYIFCIFILFSTPLLVKYLYTDVLIEIFYYSYPIVCILLWGYITYIYARYEIISMENGYYVLDGISYKERTNISAYKYLYNFKYFILLSIPEILHVGWFENLDYSTSIRVKNSASWIVFVIFSWITFFILGLCILPFFLIGLLSIRLYKIF